jgi:DNA repair exonuclease SbcCD ATPase subunit
MEKKDKELQEKLSILEEELKEVNHNLKTTETKILNLRKENIRIKQRIQKMFLAGLNDENKLRSDEIRIQQHFKETTDSQPMASHYKKLYQKKEKEVAELRKRINHMLLVEKQEAKYQKTFEEERNRLLEKLKKLKKEASNVIPDDAWKTEEDLRKYNQELERRLRDYENMKSLAETQSNLFSKLANEISGSNKTKNS